MINGKTGIPSAAKRMTAACRFNDQMVYLYPITQAILSENLPRLPIHAAVPITCRNG